jgi:TRAP-type transport system periplasmic protein
MKFKQCLPVLITLFLIGILILSGLSINPELSPNTPGSAFILKYADQNSIDGWEARYAAQPWLAQIEKATNQRVKIQTFYSESLVKGANSWAAVRLDIADMAWMFHGYWADQTPLTNVISLPLLPYKSARQASGILWALYEKYPSIRAEFQENHILLMWVSTPYFLVTAQKQVKSIDDLHGLKIRVPAGPQVEIMKQLGAIPVTIGMPDTYLYLEKGIIDSMTTAWESLLSFKQYELVRYYTYVPMFSVYFSQAINQKVWDSFPADIQYQIDGVCGLKGSLFWGENMFDTAAIVGHDVLRQQAQMSEYNIPQVEMEKWEQTARPIWEDWVKKMTDNGHPEAREILNYILELIDSYNP